MPTPIGHTLCGMLIYLLFSRAPLIKNELKWFLLAAFLAAAPDLDFLPGLITGNYNAFHRGFSHSVGGCFIVSILFWLGLKQKCLFSPVKLFLFLFVVYGSHLFLDYFSRDTAPPYGIQILWPFSQEFYISSVGLLFDAHREPLNVIFSWRNIGVYFSELLLFGLPLCFFSRKFSLAKREPNVLK